MSGQLVLYVGKTKDWKKRERQHRNGHSQCSKYIQEHPDWTMKVLEETTDALGPQREQYFYDTLDPLYNQCRPGQTRKEYWQTEAGKASQKKCDQTEARKASRKAYYQTDTGKASQKASQKAYDQTEARKASRKAYYQTDAYKASRKAYRQRQKLKSKPE